MEEIRSYGQLLQLVRTLPEPSETERRIRIAVGGPANVTILEPGLQYFFHANGVAADVSTFPYDSWVRETSESLNVDYFILWLSTYGLTSGGLQPPQIDLNFVSSWISGLNASGCVVIVIPPEISIFEDAGGYKLRAARMQALLNFEQAARTPNAILPIDHVAQEVGIPAWDPGPYWGHALYPIHPNVSARVSSYVARVVSNDVLIPIRCIAVDLDNTLWGGSVGDVGSSEIELDERSEGRHFVRMQEWLLQKRDEGFIVGVISKNDRSRAEEPFRYRREMRVQLEHLAFFEASWSPKPSVLGGVANRMNLDPSQFAFIDDSVHERYEMHTQLPSVCIPEIPTEPSDRVSFLNQSALFSNLSVSATDRLRTESYRIVQRDNTKSVSLPEYLQSLDMKIQFRPITQAEIPRAWELLQKTNQFNVTVRRPTRTEFAAEVASAKFGVTFELRDKLGEHGIIAVLIAVERQEGLELLHWVMSCRVFGRGVEWAIADYLADQCKKEGIKAVFANAVETDRNLPSRQILGSLGFKKKKREGASIWFGKLKDLTIPKHEIVLVE